MKKAIILAVLVAALSTSAGAAQFLWRSPTTGVLKSTAAPSTPSEPAGNFGLFYGTIKMLTPATLRWNPGSAKGPMEALNGYSYSGVDLANGISVDPRNGIISATFQNKGTYVMKVKIEKDGKTDVVTATLAVE
jgi:hypothetical protein